MEKIVDIRRKNMLRLIDKMFNGNVTSFAKAIEKSVSYISDIKKERKSEFTEKLARHIEEKLQLPDKFLDKTDDVINQEFDVKSFRVPEYNVQLSAGRGAEVINPENVKAHHILNDSFLTEYRVKKENLAIVSVVGHSMNPILSDGTKVVIDISRCEPIDNKVFAITTKNHTWVKRCRITPGGTIWQSDNEEYRQYDDDLNNGKSSVVIEGYVLYNLGQKVN